MRISKFLVAAVATVCAVGLGTDAQARRTWVSFSPAQTALTAGGGMADFVGSTMRLNSRMGADWDARVLWGTRSPIAFEAGYTGLYNTLSTDRATLGTVVAPYMVQTSVDGALRINLVPWRVEPYIFGGVGYNRVDVHNRDQDPAMAARFKPNDDQLMVPAGGGLAGYVGRHLTLDARFTYRAMFKDDMLINDTTSRQDSYTLAARAGYAF
jgi:hypothetical protein